jgi:hypothetical protein
LFPLENEEKYNALSVVDLDRYLQRTLSRSKLDGVIGAIAQIASELPAEKGSKQLKKQLIKIGQEFECVRPYPINSIIKISRQTIDGQCRKRAAQTTQTFVWTFTINYY